MRSRVIGRPSGGREKSAMPADHALVNKKTASHAGAALYTPVPPSEYQLCPERPPNGTPSSHNTTIAWAWRSEGRNLQSHPELSFWDPPYAAANKIPSARGPEPSAPPSDGKGWPTTSRNPAITLFPPSCRLLSELNYPKPEIRNPPPRPLNDPEVAPTSRPAVTTGFDPPRTPNSSACRQRV